MAQKTITTDVNGAQSMRCTIEREVINGTPVFAATIGCRTNAGGFHVTLTQAEIVAATTGAERTALLSVLGKLYDAALSKEGFA